MRDCKLLIKILQNVVDAREQLCICKLIAGLAILARKYQRTRNMVNFMSQQRHFVEPMENSRFFVHS